MRLAFLADIHGNLPALEAVVCDLRSQAPDQVYLLGDQVNRCPWNNEVMDLLADLNWPAIHGNHDQVVSRINTPENGPPFNDRQRFRSLWWTAETLAPRHLEMLRALPAERHIDVPDGPPIRLFHGVPGNPFVGIYGENGEDTVVALLGEVEEPVIVCGHTHRPMARSAGRWHMFNGGSVGLPYNGDPRAHYLLLDASVEQGQRTWKPHFRRVEYDRSRLRPAYERSGMLAATGAIGELHLLSASTGQPYSSDFGIWLKSQPPEIQADLDRAVPAYLGRHGPGHWAFSV
ncbi:MAG: metallophosphoesterase family protein [Caldilineaceae bacterium]|nr:metallophosphoesterase family protein [Caldilineaceae bacterium]